MKPYVIIFIFLLLRVTLFGQGISSATASATIVTSVGAENSGYIDFGNFILGKTPGTITLGSNGVRTSSGGVKLSAYGNGSITSLNIIGGSFVYDVTIEQNREADNMKVKIYKIPFVNDEGTDVVTYPIGASITVNPFQNSVYKSNIPFTVTVNFN